MRGIAVMGVVAFHSHGLFADMPWRIASVFGIGANGVQLFFVVSGLTMMLSWHARRDGAAPFYIRRLFRIAPMFWAAIILFGGLHALGWWRSGGGPIDILLTVLFVHAWSIEAINLVVPGGWTIGVEMTFYALFPLIAGLVTSRARAVAFLGLACAAAIAGNTILPHFVQTEVPQDLIFFIYYWFPHALPAFACGCLVYYLLPIAPRDSRMASGLLIAVAAIVVASAWGGLRWFSDWDHPLSRALVIPIASVMLALALAFVPARLLVNRWTCHVGKVSFSVYLLHFLICEPLVVVFAPVLVGRFWSVPAFLVSFAAVMGVTVWLAGLTYRTIEKPCIDMGNRLIKRWYPA